MPASLRPRGVFIVNTKLKNGDDSSTAFRQFSNNNNKRNMHTFSIKKPPLLTSQ